MKSPINYVNLHCFPRFNRSNGRLSGKELRGAAERRIDRDGIALRLKARPHLVPWDDRRPWLHSGYRGFNGDLMVIFMGS